MRQPQSLSVSGDIAMVSAAPVAEPARMPSVPLQQAIAPIRPRWPGGACSTMNTTEVVYSPPADRPWIMRSTISAIGAATPITA